MIPQHYKTERMAERLDIHPETLRRAAARGELHPVRIGRDFIWQEDEVRAWLQANTVDNSRVVRLTHPTPTRRTA